MIALSQEWSLLSPCTAFLVLESEQEYATWGIDRRQRHRYWKPADAQPQAPLPEQWVLRAAQRVGRAGKQSEEQRFAQVIRSIRAAIDGGTPSLADRLLDGIRNSPLATRSPEYAELSRQARAGIQRESLLRAIHSYRALLDPTAAMHEPPVNVNLLSLLAAKPTADPDFLRRHPYAEQLLKEVKLSGWMPGTGKARTGGQKAAPKAKARDNPFRPFTPVESSLQDARVTLQDEIAKQEPPRNVIGRHWLTSPGANGDFTLADLTAMLADDPGMNVVIDQKALGDVGIDADMILPGYGYGRMSLRSYARYMLHQANLSLQEEPHRLLITTPEQAESSLTTEVYPVADLLLTDRVAERNLLVDPYLDGQLAAEERIRTKLQRPINVEFRQTPLDNVIKQLAGLLDDTILVDVKALGDVGAGADTPITARWREAPAKESLRWMLRDVGLTYVVRGEALVITTPEEAESQMQTRLHSGRSVVYEYAVPANGGLPRGPRAGGSGGMAMFGMGGGMGGMGGMAMGGMGGGGSFGGGGGMGGFGGGFGAAGGMGVTPSDSTAVGLSSGGDATVPPEPTEPAPATTAPPGAAAPPSAAQTGSSLNGLSGGGAQADFDGPTDMIMSMIKPTSWDSVGGPGSIAVFEPTLDFVVSATEEVHEQIDILLERLRKLPLVGRGWRPVTLNPVDPDPDGPLDFDSLIDLITSTVFPTTWDAVGGPGSISRDEPHAALILSQTQDLHDSVSNLLTMLRRSRYETLHSDRPWKLMGQAPDQPWIAAWAASNAPTVRLSALPEPRPEELGALSGRRLPESGLWEWRRTEPGGSGSETIVLRRQAGRLEIRLPDRVLRAEGDVAAIAWPGLGLVELGNWGEGVRQMADRWLPWLPHRTNDQLARLFHVVKTDAGRVHLIPIGLPTSANTWLEAEFGGPAGMPRFWHSQVDGKLTGRLRLENSAGHPTVTMEDDAGKVLTRWELVRSETDNVAVSALDADRQSYVLLDRRSPEPAVDRPMWNAFEAIGKSDWSKAIDNLRELQKTRAKHPLLQLLTAWCCEHDPRLGSREQMVTLLKEVARQGMGPLIREVSEENFPSLSPVQQYEILSCQPVKTLTAAEQDRLAQVAAKAGRLGEALAHAQAALLRGNGERQFERHYAVVELLLRLEKTGEAVKTARRWAAAVDATPEPLAAVAELLAKYGAQPPADELFVRALAAKELAPQRRFGLMCRRAAIQQGLRRWQLLLDAAEAVPAASPGRRQCLEMIVAELVDPSQAEVAAQLAGRTHDPDLKAGLMLTQAELSTSPEDRAEIYWQIYKVGRLPGQNFNSAFNAWNLAKQPQRVIEAAEQGLRSGRRLGPQTELGELTFAYRAVGCELDARRAASADPEPPESPKSPPGRDRRSRGQGMGMGMF
jgi:hypothetical protein